MPSWLRRVSAGFRTSTVTFSIIAPPADGIHRVEAVINGEYQTDYKTGFTVFLLIDYKRVALDGSLTSPTSYRQSYTITHKIKSEATSDCCSSFSKSLQQRPWSLT